MSFMILEICLFGFGIALEKIWKSFYTSFCKPCCEIVSFFNFSKIEIGSLKWQ